jgi:hypothetical protein
MRKVKDLEVFWESLCCDSDVTSINMDRYSIKNNYLCIENGKFISNCIDAEISAGLYTLIEEHLLALVTPMMI